MTELIKIGLLIATCLWISEGCADAPEADVPFVQEYHVAYPIEPGGPGDDVRAIAVDQSDTVWAATKAGVRVLRKG